MAETNVKCVKLKSDRRIQNERILWDSLLSTSEEEKVTDLSRGEMGKLRTYPCLVTGMSRACRGCHGDNGIWASDCTSLIDD